jgi:predicted esterase
MRFPPTKLLSFTSRNSRLQAATMNWKQSLKYSVCILCFCAATGMLAPGHSPAAETKTLQPGQEIEISFADAGLPPTLYSMMEGEAVMPCVTVRLPDDYNSTNTYPLLVYVPGNDGGPKGNIYNAETIAGPRGWIVATLPLFKKSIDRSEPAAGIIISFEDYPVISKAYRTMLGRLFERIPNIDREKSAMVGFSNGSITIAVLVSNHDEFILSHFRNFCLVDHGMFHLADLHKSRARDCRFLLLVGDQEGLGRDVKIRQAQLQQDAWKLLGVDVTCQIMKDTGHEFNQPQMEIVGDWLRNEVMKSQNSTTNASTLK